MRAPVFQEYNSDKNFEIKKDHKLALSYDNFNTQEVLKETLPPNTEIPGGFEIIGSIAHLNLSDEQMPYRKIIGQVLLDKNPSLKTVVSKIG